MSNIKLQMYTLRDFTKTREDFLSTIKKVHNIGYRGLQAKCPPFMEPTEFKEILDNYGMTTDSVSYKLAEIEPKLEEIVKLSNLYGTTKVRVEAMPHDYSLSASGFEKYALMLEKGGKILHSAGLKLIYHFHAFEFVNFADGKRGIDILLDNTTAMNVWFQPDIFWLAASGTEVSESLRMFVGRADSIHVKDYGIRPRENNILERIPYQYLPVGCGNLSWHRIIPTALDMGIKNFVVEQDSCDGDPFDCVKISFDNLTKMGIGG